MADDISEGEPRFSVSQEVHRFVAEGRKGGEATQETNDQKGSRLFRDHATMIDQLG